MNVLSIIGAFRRSDRVLNKGFNVRDVTWRYGCFFAFSEPEESRHLHHVLVVEDLLCLFCI